MKYKVKTMDKYSRLKKQIEMELEWAKHAKPKNELDAASLRGTIATYESILRTIENFGKKEKWAT